MSKRLEDFIRANKDEFNDLEPRDALWAKIEDKLPFTDELPGKREAKTFSLYFVLRMAAIIIIVMGVAFELYLQNEKRNGVNLAAINLPAQVPELAAEVIRPTRIIREAPTKDVC